MNAENTLLRATGRRHFVREYAGPLSIKTVVAGEVTWMVDGRPHTVRPGSMLVLNDGQPYSMDIDERHPVATAVVFFASGFVEQACRPLNLDEPFIAPNVGFHTRVRPLSKQLKRNMRLATSTPSPVNSRLSTAIGVAFPRFVQLRAMSCCDGCRGAGNS